MTTMTSTLTRPVVGTDPSASRPLDAGAVHAAHADFVWRSLHHLGVREADLPDMLQEVFVVVHRRLASFDAQSRITTWLFGICLRVASGYRRRAWRRREQPTDPHAYDTHTAGGGAGDPEQAAALSQARARLAQILDEMDLEKRAAFVLYELEGMPCSEIAALVGAPIGTVHSRLHAARKIFTEAAARFGSCTTTTTHKSRGEEDEVTP